MTESGFLAERMWSNGYEGLVSVVPPGAQLTPLSKISQSSAGKVPGRKTINGLYAGFDWRKHATTEADVKTWCLDGSSIGLRSENFPGLDIDCLDESLAAVIADAAIAQLGDAPIRTGRFPKRLLMYRLEGEPFSRMRLHIRKGKDTHLVELLAAGQQYVVSGTHPVTNKPYAWDREVPPAAELPSINRAQADAFFAYLKDLLEMLSLSAERDGDGNINARAATDQKGLSAPSDVLLREAVQSIPNNDDLFPSRDDYVAMGYAIKAAGGDDAFPIFAEWAGRHESDGRVAGNPDTWLSDWRRMRAPFSVGWNWIAEQAKSFGFQAAALDFDVIDEAPRAGEEPIAAPRYSDQWLVDKVVDARHPELRFVPQKDQWIVWNRGRWQPDAELLAEDLVKQELRIIADGVMRSGSNEKEKQESNRIAIQICSAGKASAVRGLMQSERAVAVSVDALDYHPWQINTPNGIIELRTGEVLPPDPDALCTKSTSVVADFTADCPEWKRFLREATNKDGDLIRYLQRLCGYCLTGQTTEQNVTFIYGPGGNGKSVFVNVLSGIIGDYAKVADMTTFTASNAEKHSTDIAMLLGSRLVTASETQAGKRWDNAKVKSLSGGEPVTARFMRQDNFTFLPQFKLVFIGNHKPELRDIDDAMRRRIQMVPFVVKPAVVDMQLSEKLRAEWPAILAWMVEGCLEWRAIGLNPPQSVRVATEEYFAEEDAIGRWMSERLDLKPDAVTSSTDLFNRWREWANENGEFVGSQKRLSAALVSKKLEKRKEVDTRRVVFSGVEIIRQEFGTI